MRLIKLSLITAALITFCFGVAMAGTLQDVKAKGQISVGVNEGLFGFSKPDEKGPCPPH